MDNGRPDGQPENMMLSELTNVGRGMKIRVSWRNCNISISTRYNQAT